MFQVEATANTKCSEAGMYLETTKPIWLVDSRWGGAGEEEQEYIQEACMDVGRKGFQRISYYRVQVKTLQPTGQI